ncbi:PDZ domain-containing protein [Okeania sp. SIO2B3]|uniref:PDZ domain-containing protein n=1 Tax=Okeania sp. SIO2B3 TaxID=2607784 RepID=UPI0025EE7C9A|nr:PDZ domain-containing protein [Okeania sp. SIO2B3]
MISSAHVVDKVDTVTVSLNDVRQFIGEVKGTDEVTDLKEIKYILARGEQLPYPSVGIQMISLTPEIAKENNADPNSILILPEVNGVLVTKVLSGTAAEKAGIRRGDVIVEIDNQSIVNAEQLQRKVEAGGVGQKLQFNILRNGREKQLFVVSGQMIS